MPLRLIYHVIYRSYEILLGEWLPVVSFFRQSIVAFASHISCDFTRLAVTHGQAFKAIIVLPLCSHGITRVTRQAVTYGQAFQTV